MHGLLGSCLFDPDTTSSLDPRTCDFSHFRAAAMNFTVPYPMAPPDRLPSIPRRLDGTPLILSEEVPGWIDEAEAGNSLSGACVRGGEDMALHRLNALTCNRQTRTQDVIADACLGLSSWLAVGCVSPRTVYHKVSHLLSTLEQHEDSLREYCRWLLFELVWRDFFFHKGLAFPSAFAWLSGPMGVSQDITLLGRAKGRTEMETKERHVL
mmetsp:Transcript_1627/g.2461  ORF Transcript_1627/g.2461 Transcript_1627/m.2461 type:complete len:210 (+) Transcript_1627:618-1247(+)